MSDPYNSAPERPFEAVDSIPIPEAVICVNCGNVVRAKNEHCPVCESASVINLAVLLAWQPCSVRLVDRAENSEL